MEHRQVEETEEITQVFSIETSQSSEVVQFPSKAHKILSLDGVGYTAPVHQPPPAPKDKCFLVWLVFFFNAGGFWLAWNLMNFMGPYYYFDYWFSAAKTHIPTKYATDFLNALGMLACSPLFAMGYIALIPFACVKMLYRYGAALMLYTLCVLTLLIATCSWSRSNDERSAFFTFSVTIILICMGAVGTYQSFLYGLAADFPRIYTSAVVIGTNAGGLLASLLYVFCTHKSNIDPKVEVQTAKVYYGVTFAYLVLSIASVAVFYFSKFYWHYSKEDAFTGISADIKKFLRGFGEVFMETWRELLGIFMIFFTMYAIFPTISVGIQPWPPTGQAKLPKYFLPIGTFLNFYTMSTIGAIASAFIKFPATCKRARNLLLIPSYVSMYLIVYFMFCNFYPNAPKVRTAKVLFKNEWFYFIGNGFLGLLTGVLSGILMPLTSQVVRPELRRLAGQMALASLLTGLYLGAGMTPGFIAALTVKYD